MEHLSQMWNRPLIECQWRQMPCQFAYKGEFSDGPLRFKCALGYTAHYQGNHYSQCQHKPAAARGSRPTSKPRRVRKRTARPKATPTWWRQRIKPLWIARGFAHPNDGYCYK